MLDQKTRKYTVNAASGSWPVQFLDQVHKFPHVGKFMHLGSGYFAVDGNLPSETILP